MRATLALFILLASSLVASSARADGLAVTPASANAEPGQRITFKGEGGSGSGDYRWALLDAPSGGTIDKAGLYIAGPKENEDDIVILTDPVGNTTQATVHVAPGINLAGGADADNRCSVGVVGGARGPSSSVGALALGLALMLTRRRRG